MNKKLKYSPLLIVVFLGAVMLFSIENVLIFFPDRFPTGDWTPTTISPEDATFETDDGIKLHGWYVRPENPRAFAVYSHGNGGNITGLAAYLAIMSKKLNIATLAYDYRGYGKSNGSPSIKGAMTDAIAATKWLEKREGLPASDFIQIGRSLGGGIAVQTAVATNAKALVLESTFTSIAAMGKMIYPWLPVGLLLRQDLDSFATIGKFKGPVLLFHGDHDEVVPYVMGEKLYEAVPGAKKFIPIPGGTHNDFPPPYYFIEIDQLLDQIVGRKIP